MDPTSIVPPRASLTQKDGGLARAPWWALALVALALIFVFLLATSQNYRETFFYLQTGVVTTLRMTLIAFPIATLLGLVGGLCRTSKNVFLFNLATLYVEVIRGIPLIVIILYIGLGLVPVLVDAIKNVGTWGMTWGADSILAGFFTGMQTFSIRVIPFEMRAVIALAIGYGAFEAEVFRAGIQSIGKGQMEAARSLGMSYMQAMRFIILPQAIRRVLPPLGNDFIALLKDSSLATVLAVNELTQLGRLRRASTFRYLETFNVVAFLYLAMTLLLSAGVRLLERVLKYEE
jgi:polar amino acid transport system permease protein